MIGTRAREENRRQVRVTWTLLLLLLLLLLGGVNVWRKSSVNVPHDGLAIRDTATGPVVVGIEPSSPAHRAGIAANDIITGINGLPVGTAVEYGLALGSSGAAAESVYTINRQGRRLNRVVQVAWRPDGDLLYVVLSLTGAAALLLGGVVGIFGRRDRESFLLAGICFSFAGVMLLSPIGSWDTIDLLVNALDDAATLLLPLLFLGFCSWFPATAAGSSTPAWRGRRLMIIWTVSISAGLTLLFVSWYVGLATRPGNPYTTTTMYNMLRRLSLGWLGSAMVLGGLLAAFRIPRARDPLHRQQLLWIALGALLGGTPPLILYFLPYLAGFQPAGWQAMSMLTFILVPVTFGAAVLRYRLADTQLVLKRSMVYSLSSAVTLFTILLALGAAARWLPAVSDPRRPAGMIFWAVTAMTISAIFFPRIKDSLARSADRLHFGDRLGHRERLAVFDPFRLDPSLPSERLVEMFMDDVVLAMEVDPIRFWPPGAIPPDLPLPQPPRSKQTARRTAGRRCRVGQPDTPWQGFYQLLIMESAGGGQRLGVIGMGPRRGGALLSSQDLEALLPAAELLAMALENSLLTSRLMEQQRLASIGQLAAGVAHEINTPLTGISSYTEMLLENIPARATDHPGDGAPAIIGEAEQVEMLKKIGRQAERAEKIVSSLLQFARKRGSMLLPADLNLVTRQAVSLFEHQLKGAAVEFRLDLCQGPLPVTGDTGQLQQVLINLMSNALDAMPQGGLLSVNTRPAAEHAVVTVSDSGHGIPRDLLRRIFEPFFTTKAPGSGTGLGLSICYGIIREHRGDISVDSRPGAGTVFTVTLPRGSVGDE